MRFNGTLTGWVRQIPSRVVRMLQVATLAVFLGFNLVSIAYNISLVPLIDEIDYGDSYILYDVLHFQKTGVIYRDLSQPPYLPAQYSPMIYVLFALPGRLVNLSNPFLGPRLIVLLAFVACVAITASITQTLLQNRLAGLFGAFLACSVTVMWGWILQIRADFLGIFFSLLALRLLLCRPLRYAFAAGLCAGLALQFKVTFVAAAAAGTMWLLGRREWRGLALFVCGAIATSGGLYAAFAWREPRMLAQMFALSPGIVDIGGDMNLLHSALRELVVLLALVGLARIGRGMAGEWGLLVVFVATSTTVAAVSALQAGGNVNYYYEPLFGLVPPAVVGAMYILSLMSANSVFAVFLLAYFGAQFVLPRLGEVLYALPGAHVSVQARNAEFLRLEGILKGRRVFSTVPRLALLDPAPAVTEPYLLSYLHLLGKADPSPIVKGVYQGDYDVVITSARRRGWRGIYVIDPEVRNAIRSSYTPDCTLGPWLFHAPKRTGSAGPISGELRAIGCVASTSQNDLAW